MNKKMYVALINFKEKNQDNYNTYVAGIYPTFEKALTAGKNYFDNPNGDNKEHYTIHKQFIGDNFYNMTHYFNDPTDIIEIWVNVEDFYVDKPFPTEY